MAVQDVAKPSARVLGVLLASAFVLALLALYQWMELRVAAAGGKLACSVSATLDCAPVWGSAAAKAIAGLTGMPVAALGLVWGLGASVIAGVLVIRQATGAPLAAWIAAARWTALAGVLACLGLAAVSLSIGVWCPTCLVTYAVTLVFAASALYLPGALRSEGLGAGLGWAAGLSLVGYLALLGPARSTAATTEELARNAVQAALANKPSASATPAASATPVASATAANLPADDISDLVRALPPRGQQILADVILEYKSGAPVTRAATDKPRFVAGPAAAPVSMTEWTDIMCGHCAEFVLTLKEIMGRLPPGMVRVEPRQFPLDKECNPGMERSVGDGVRCAAARALVCLEGSDAFFEAQVAMFKEQSSLTKPRVLELARAQAFDKQAFDRCLGAPETQKKIDADIAAAVAAGLHGTPHVLLNGKVAPPFGPFLYLFLAGGGKLEHPALALLPPGNPPEPHDHAH